MTWYAYEVPPIDFGWELMPTVEQFAEEISRRMVKATIAHEDPSWLGYSLHDYLADFERAQELSTKAGWEGDYRPSSEPRVFMVPEGGSFRHAFAWKQDNNGTTYIVSPRKLPWLADGYNEVVTSE